MKEHIEQIRIQAEQELAQADSDREVEEIRIRYLGKKGALTSLLKELRNVSPDERPAIGSLLNTLKSDLESSITDALTRFVQKQREEKI